MLRLRNLEIVASFSRTRTDATVAQVRETRHPTRVFSNVRAIIGVWPIRVARVCFVLLFPFFCAYLHRVSDMEG